MRTAAGGGKVNTTQPLTCNSTSPHLTPHRTASTHSHSSARLLLLSLTACTEVGYWQTAREPGQSIRSQRINRAYYQQLCKEVFGVTDLPAINATNNYYGGAHLATSNTFFVNGVEDPWQWASVRRPLAGSVPAVVVNCTQCAHCVEEYTPKANDAAELVEVRRRVTAFVRRLLA